MKQTMTFDYFTSAYYDIKFQCPSYRYGQHFINMFIKDSSSQEMIDLWNEENIMTACDKACEIIERYHWDYDDLPLVDRYEEESND